MIQTIVQWLCVKLWDFAERKQLSLGRLAPYVFGGMLWRWPHKTPNSNRRSYAGCFCTGTQSSKILVDERTGVGVCAVCGKAVAYIDER